MFTWERYRRPPTTARIGRNRSFVSMISVGAGSRLRLGQRRTLATGKHRPVAARSLRHNLFLQKPFPACRPGPKPLRKRFWTPNFEGQKPAEWIRLYVTTVKTPTLPCHTSGKDLQGYPSCCRQPASERPAPPPAPLPLKSQTPINILLKFLLPFIWQNCAMRRTTWRPFSTPGPCALPISEKK